LIAYIIPMIAISDFVALNFFNEESCFQGPEGDLQSTFFLLQNLYCASVSCRSIGFSITRSFFKKRCALSFY